jgi:hypothetical protein
MMRQFFKRSLLGAAVALGFAATSALALPATQTAFTIGVVNEFSDDNVELHYDNNNDGLINTGDYLLGLIAITSFGPSSTPGSAVNQMSGVYAVEITDTVAITSDAQQAAGCGSAASNSCSAYEFGAVPDLNTLLATVGLGALDPLDDGSVIALLFEDVGAQTLVPTPVQGGTVNGNFAVATDDVLRLVVSLIPANGDSFFGIAPASLADFGNVTQGTGVGSINLNLTIAQQFYPGINLGPDITGRGTISQTASGPFVIGSDTTFFTRVSQVPEPGTLALLALGLLGLGAAGRRKH